MSLWKAIESDVDATPLPQNPTTTQIRKHEEEAARKAKKLLCIHQLCRA